jgi:hypothetical protein
METTIYYFTGTGNSLEVARDLGARLSAAKPLPIAAFRERAQVTPEGQIIGLVFPVYDWNAPAIVANFVGIKALSINATASSGLIRNNVTAAGFAKKYAPYKISNAPMANRIGCMAVSSVLPVFSFARRKRFNMERIPPGENGIEILG